MEIMKGIKVGLGGAMRMIIIMITKKAHTQLLKQQSRVGTVIGAPEAI